MRLSACNFSVYIFADKFFCVYFFADKCFTQICIKAKMYRCINSLYVLRIWKKGIYVLGTSFS